MGLFSWLFGSGKKSAQSNSLKRSSKDKNGKIYVDPDGDRQWIDLEFQPTPLPSTRKWVQFGKRREVAGTHHHMSATLAFVERVTRGGKLVSPHGIKLRTELGTRFSPDPYQIFAWVGSEEHEWKIGYVDAESLKALRAFPSDMPMEVQLAGLRQWQAGDKKRLYITYSIHIPQKPERRKNGWLSDGET